MQYYTCPECKEKVSNISIHNGLDTQFYSDEYLYCPMARSESDLDRCTKCQSFIWLSNVELIEDIGLDKPVEYTGDLIMDKIISRCKRPRKRLSLAEYQKALSDKVYTSDEEEFYIRKFIWWLYNDRVREGKDLCRSKADEREWRENDLRLLELLNLGAGVEYTKMLTQERSESQKKGEDGEDDWVRVETTIDNSEKLKLMYAEINRNLGLFKECVKALENVIEEDHQSVKNIIIKECENKNTLVVKVTSMIA